MYSLKMGCLVEFRLIGVLQANQQDKGKEPERNDRTVAVPLVSHDVETIQKIDDLGENHLNYLTHFFEYYRAMSGRMFTPLANKTTAIRPSTG